MKNILAYGLLISAVFTACVQKTYDKTVVYTLKTEALKNIQTVGIRGNDKPINWDNDLPLTAIKPDSLYRTTVTYKTGYKFTEVKFVVDGEFELQNAPNRKVVFKDTDTTYYEITFNQPQ